MLLRIADFKGSIPRLHPRLLPDPFAQVAQNTRLENGAIGPLRATVLTHTFATAVRSFVQHNSTWRGWTVPVNAVQGPVAQDRLYVTGDGSPKMIVGATTYALGIAAPDGKPTLTLVGTADPATAETILYCYTFVSSFGEESAPSPASDPLSWSGDLSVIVSGFSAPPAGRAITKIRLYRSQTSITGTTDFYLVSEFPVSDNSHTHTLSLEPLQEVLPSADYDAPPADLAGLIAMPNGMMAAFSGRKLYFCEPYLPHAWPSKYSLTVDFEIVGLSAFGSTVAILTTGQPYIAQGSHPENMQMEKVEQNLPCVSARGIVDLGYQAVYPSTEGLVAISSQGAQILSKNLWTREQWASLTPSSFVAAQYDGRYVFSHVSGTGRALGLVDLSGQQPYLVTSSVQAAALWHDIRTGSLYALLGSDLGTQVVKWDAGAHLSQKWRSKLFHLPQPVNFGAILIEGDDVATATTFTARVYADGVLKRTFTDFNRPARLPAGFLSEKWEVEIEGNLSVTSISLAGSIEELGG